MNGRQPMLRKAGLLLAVAVLLTSVGAAVSYGGYGGGSGVTQFLNQYFLPADAPVQGVSGLLFGVLLPIGIVIILFDIGASRVLSDNRRAARALAIMFSLFMIPSGAYKVISNMLIGIFGVTGVASGVSVNPVLPAVGPLSGVGFAGIAAAITFIVLAYQFQSGGQQNNITASEMISAVVATVLVYLVLSGGFSFTKFITTAIILAIGWFVFKTGLEAQSNAGNIIALLGLIMMLGAIRSTEMLPRGLDSMLGTVTGGAITVIVIILIALIVAAVLLFMYFFGDVGALNRLLG